MGLRAGLDWCGKSHPTGIRSPDRPARRQSVPCSTFTITKVQLHVSAINVGHLQVVHEELINKLYQHVWGVYSVWGGVGERSRFVLEKGVWTGAVLGIMLKYHSCLLTAMSISGLHFLICTMYIGKTILSVD